MKNKQRQRSQIMLNLYIKAVEDQNNILRRTDENDMRTKNEENEVQTDK